MEHRRRVRVSAIHPGRISLEDIPTTSAILGVSLANPTFAGPSLPPLLDWATLHFRHVIILLGDYLERHNIPSADPIVAADCAMEKAKRLRSHIERCVSRFPRGRFTLESANDLMHKATFTTAYNCLLHHYDTNQLFQETVMADVNEYLDRKPRIIGTTKEETIRRSVTYILEELALFSQLVDQGHRVQIYPGRHLRVFTSLATQQIVTPLAGLNQLICVDVQVGH